MTPTKNPSALAFLLGAWANMLPTVWRKRIYRGVKVLSGIATLVLLVLPFVPDIGVYTGVDLNDERLYVVFTGLLAFLGHLADSNTDVEPPLDTPTEPPL